MTHDLKCWPEFFAKSWKGLKTLEVRLNDRNYREGDTVIRREWNPGSKHYTGRSIEGKIVYLTTFMQRSGWVVFQVRETSRRRV